MQSYYMPTDRGVTNVPCGIVFFSQEGGGIGDADLLPEVRRELFRSRALGQDRGEAAAALSGFTGLRRRFDIVGTRNGVTVIDDFGHNPDKIAATLATLHAFPGRLLIFFQPHGSGPLQKMGRELIDRFDGHLPANAELLMTHPPYYGRTVAPPTGKH